ncbi:hypothetical protein ABL850_22895 [Variovorax paradoxus]|jgi:hypothetical protein|uniref:hypothetical protein n=1 Tax=Variovorax paradoxus TaxID=34073 RepID=UPI003AAB2314
MIATAVAQPLPAASAPAQAASAPVPGPSTPQAATVPVNPAYNAITVQLQDGKKDKDWYVDPTFWAAVVPAIAVLVTIWNTNKQLKFSRESQDRQLADDRARQEREIKAEHERARLDRVTKARQEIYSGMLADYQKVQGLIANLPEGDLDKEITFTEIAVMSANVNKLWVWGETESAYQVREFFSQVNEMAWLARGKAEAIRTLKRQYNHLNNQVAESARERDKAAQKIREHEARAEYLHKEETWIQMNNRLQQDYKAHEANRSSASDLLLKVSVRIVERRQAYQEFLIEAQDKLMLQVNKVMALARGDVQLEGDVSRLEKQSHEMSARARAAIVSMRTEYEEQMELARLI